jgi:hypothetical protein
MPKVVARTIRPSDKLMIARLPGRIATWAAVRTYPLPVMMTPQP